MSPLERRLRLTVVDKPPENAATVISTGPDFPADEPLIRSEDREVDLQMVCGSCERVLFDGIAVSQIRGGYFQCPRCRAWNRPLAGL